MEQITYIPMYITLVVQPITAHQCSALQWQISYCCRLIILYLLHQVKYFCKRMYCRNIDPDPKPGLLEQITYIHLQYMTLVVKPGHYYPHYSLFVAPSNSPSKIFFIKLQCSRKSHIVIVSLFFICCSK